MGASADKKRANDASSSSLTRTESARAYLASANEKRAFASVRAFGTVGSTSPLTWMARLKRSNA